LTQILIADDHPLFRLALKQAIVEVVPGAQVGEAGSLDAARAQLEQRPDTDLVLLDLHMPGNHGLLGLTTLRGEHPAVAVAMISAHEDPHVIRRALAFGAAGWIPKRAGIDQLKRAVRCVLDCGEWVPESLREAVDAAPTSPTERELAARLAALTPQQFRVLALVAEGKLNKQIADALAIQERTIKAHLSAIFVKLGVRNRTQAGVMLRSLEIADPAQREIG